MSLHKEISFETRICERLAANGWQVELRNCDGGGLEAWLTVPA